MREGAKSKEQRRQNLINEQRAKIQSSYEAEQKQEPETSRRRPRAGEK